jgi:hypothetical protein
MNELLLEFVSVCNEMDVVYEKFPVQSQLVDAIFEGNPELAEIGERYRSLLEQINTESNK